MTRNAPIEELLGEARQQFENKRPQTLKAHLEAEKFMPGGNTRSVLYHGPYPIRITHGEDATLTDVDGHRYLNLLGEYTAGVFGHSHPAITKAVKQALDAGINLSAHNSKEGELARLISERFPAIEKVRFTNSGTEANLMAISTARAITGKQKVLVFEGGYHGALLYFGSAGSPINAPFSYVKCPYNDPASLEKLVIEHGDDLACIIVESMQGSGGCISGTPEFLSALRPVADKAGAMLILDEVMTSRFSRHGAGEMFGIKPDLTTLGKWVGGGMSFGAFGGKADIMDHYDPARPDAIRHAGTFNNNSISMNAGIAALSEAFTSDYAETLHVKGEKLRADLNSLLENQNVDLSACGMRSLMNIHAMKTIPSRVKELAQCNDQVRQLLFLDLLERGYYIAERGFIALSMEITDQDLSGFIKAMEEIIEARKAVLQSGV